MTIHIYHRTAWYPLTSASGEWRIALVQEIIDVKSKILEVASFTTKELDTIDKLACCSLHLFPLFQIFVNHCV